MSTNLENLNKVKKPLLFVTKQKGNFGLFGSGNYAVSQKTDPCNFVARHEHRFNSNYIFVGYT